MNKIHKEEKVDIYLTTTGDEGNEDYKLSIRDKSGSNFYMKILSTRYTDDHICIFKDEDDDDDDEDYDDKDERIRRIVREIMDNGTME